MLRLTTYIDDFLSISSSVYNAMLTAVELVYEAAACGLTLNIRKWLSLAPISHR